MKKRAGTHVLGRGKGVSDLSLKVLWMNVLSVIKRIGLLYSSKYDKKKEIKKGLYDEI